MSKVNDISGKQVGRRSGGVNTKAQILRAAQTLFAAEGLDRTTIRQIAAQAEVDPALVMHYFKTKKQLFIESIAPIVQRRQSSIASTALAKTSHDLRGEKLAEALVFFMIDKEVQPLLLGIVRSVTSDENAVKILKNLIEHTFTSEIEKYINGPNKKLRSELVGTQLIGLVLARYIVKVEPLASASPDILVKYLAPRLQVLFDEGIA